MAFTGDLEFIHIADIIQLIHTTKKSGTFIVKGSRGKSQIIFSNGYIVSANHLNKIRIGTVLVKINAITREDLEQALEFQRKAGKDRKPLISTLIEMGKISHQDAFKGLKKLIEITIVELIGWTKGTFTLDTEPIAVSPECYYIPDKMKQEISIDAQMALMDALRIYDEQERDRNLGKQIPVYEELFKDVIPSEDTLKEEESGVILTADDLGLADIDQLKKKIPEPFPTKETLYKEIFDPVEIHRQKIREILSDFSPNEQETFVSFLEKSTSRISTPRVSERLEAQNKVLILFSQDRLLKHSLMTICKHECILAFSTDDEKELYRLIDECITKEIIPIMVFDKPKHSGDGDYKEIIVALRQQIKKRYPKIFIIQLASIQDYDFVLESFQSGVKTVFPKPLKELHKETFIKDTINFLNIFKSYIKGLYQEQKTISPDNQIVKLKNQIMSLRDLKEPLDAFNYLLQIVSEIFDRSIIFLVRQPELIGQRAIGINVERNTGPTSAAKLSIPLTKPSIFRDVIEKEKLFYGESNDEILKEYIFEKIGSPLKSTILLLPIKSRGKIIALTYGDFGMKEEAPVQTDILEIIVNQAGLVMENIIYRKHLKKTI